MIFKSLSYRLPAVLLTVCMGLLASGCGDAAKPNSGQTGTSTSIGQTIYVGSNQGFLQFSTNQNGDVTPISSLTPSDKLTPLDLGLDATGNIYGLGNADLTASDGNTYSLTEISVFPAGSKGNTTALRTIGGLVPVFTNPVLSMLPHKSGEIYAASEGIILVFGADASGGIAPIRGITSLATLQIDSFAIDSSSNLYVATSGPKIWVFSPTADGSATPIRTLSGSSTQIGGSIRMAFDSGGNLYVKSSTSGSPNHIGVFLPQADGNVSPIRTITGTANHPMGDAGMAFDSSDNLYVLSRLLPSSPRIDKYAAGTSGSVDPIAQIRSSAHWTNPGKSIAIF